ncbi:MAG: AsmA-like C-terminal region-containing protein [Luminiphilus sp.]|nr:AsmA-like C-terminal region-containing protein [Luminiphilus sp.]
MVKAVPRLLGRIIWPGLVMLIVLLAIYVSGGRLLMAALPGAQQQVIEALSERFPVQISVGAAAGKMDGFSPRIELRDFSLVDELSGQRLALSEASVRIDPWQSLLSGTLRADVVTLLKPRLHRPGPASQRIPEIPQTFWEILNSFGRVQVRGAQLAQQWYQTDPHSAVPAVTIDLDLERERSQRSLSLSVYSGSDVLMMAEGSGTGNPGDIKQFLGELHGTISGKGLSLLADSLGVDLRAEGSLNFWYGVSHEEPSGVIEVALENIFLSGERVASLDTFTLQSALRGVPGSLEVWVQNLSIGLAQKQIALPRIHIKEVEEGWGVRTESFDVAPMIQVLANGKFLSDKALDVIKTLEPSGHVSAMELLIASFEQPLEAWTISAEVSDITTAPYRGVPGLAGIDAYLSASETGAQAWIDTDDFTLSLPKVYQRPIHIQKVTGQLAGRWQRDGMFLEDGLLLARAADHDATVQFEIDIPFSASSSIARKMRLAVAMTGAPIAVRNNYIPHRLPEPTYLWLQKTIGSGTVSAATFLWHGGLKPYGDPGQTTQLSVDFSGVTLDYQDAWPPADLPFGQLRLSDGVIDVFASSAIVANIDLEDIRVGVRMQPGHALFLLEAESGSPLSAMVEGMRQLPALSPARPVLDDLVTKGSARTELGLSFDLVDIRETVNVEVSALLDDAFIYSDFLDLKADMIHGRLFYSTQSGFEGESLQAEIFGRPVQVDLGPHLARGPPGLLAARLSVPVSVEDILSWQSITGPFPADGSAIVNVTAEVADDISVTLQSNLDGVTVSLPQPWGKFDQTRAPLYIEWSDRGWAPWEVFWFGRFTAVADFSNGLQPAVAVDITPRTRPSGSRRLSPSLGVHVRGYVPSFDPTDWLSALLESSGGLAAFSSLTIDDLQIGRLLWQGQEMGAATLRASVAAPAFEADFTLPWVRGVLRQTEATPLADSAAMIATQTHRMLEIEYLDVASLPDISEQSPLRAEEWLAKWMPISVSVEQVYRGSTDLGNVQFEAALNGGWEFREVAGNLLGIEWLPDTHLAWQADDEAEVTTLTLAAQLQDISDSLALLGVAPLLETRSGRLEAGWRWQGSPADFDLSAVEGTLTLAMQSGSFTSAKSEAEGVMRLLSLMNLSGLLRRANINQLFDPGVTFDSAGGRFEFDQGILRMPGFSVEGSGGYFTFVSEIDLDAETLDGELIVTLPLVENIPWVAALAGGLPVAAGTYLVSKVFEDQVNQLSSGIYSVSGDLNEPQVVFERVFDAKSRLPEKSDQGASASPSASEAR